SQNSSTPNRSAFPVRPVSGLPPVLLGKHSSPSGPQLIVVPSYGVCCGEGCCCCRAG
uniref:Uncharacterized protein n=1 Tax=Anopheles quadriannulatus TaxID=34691 RepID=A0A182XU15_ANOQN